MAEKTTKKKQDSTTKHVVISAVAHETLTVLADRYGKSMGEMVALLIDNCYDYGLILPEDSKTIRKGGKVGTINITTRIDKLEKQLKRFNDANFTAIAEIKKINNSHIENIWKAVEESQKTVALGAQVFAKLSEIMNKNS